MDKPIRSAGVISTSERQITIFYHTGSERAKQTLVYARTHGLVVEEIDVSKTPLTGTQIAELANRLGVEIKDLINHEHNKYTGKFNFKDFTCEDWITMIQNHPEIMKQPIALRGNKTILVETPTDILKI